MANTDLSATLVQQIACNVLSVAATAIPWSVVEHTKALILDSIGCALAATEEPEFARASRVLVQLGGNPDCTVIARVHGVRHELLTY
jgi:2-methylcitrate dehydratase PrpD